MKCPQCRRYVEDGSESHAVCGWNVQQSTYAPTVRAYRPCEWTSDGRSCLYPGSMSTNTHEGGPWYCALHFACDSASYGASVVEASMTYRHPTQDEIEAEHLEQARARLKAQGLDRQPNETTKAWMARTRRVLPVKRFEDAA